MMYDAKFQTAIKGYPMGAVVRTSDGDFVSLIDDNMEQPCDSAAGWRRTHG
jgi:hypothetical protein